MIAEIDQMLKAEGYRFLKVQPEEAGVYYRYENGTVEVILGLLDHSAFQMNAAVCASMKEHIRELFFLSHGRVPGITEEMPVYQVVSFVLRSRIRWKNTVCSVMRCVVSGWWRRVQNGSSFMKISPETFTDCKSGC